MYIRQYREVSAGLKTLTQRVLTPEHSIIGRFDGDPVKITFTSPFFTYQFPEGYRPVDLDRLQDGLDAAGVYRNGRCLYHVGGVYTVMHKRGKPSVRRSPFPSSLPLQCLIVAPQTKEQGQLYDDWGWLPLKIEIVKIRYGRLQAMNDADVTAEGVTDRAACIALWDSINGAGAWNANPLVARIGFRLSEGAPPAVPQKTMTGKVLPERRLT